MKPLGLANIANLVASYYVFAIPAGGQACCPYYSNLAMDGTTIDEVVEGVIATEIALTIVFETYTETETDAFYICKYHCTLMAPDVIH
jgi:hypothetical protein